MRVQEQCASDLARRSEGVANLWATASSADLRFVISCCCVSVPVSVGLQVCVLCVCGIWFCVCCEYICILHICIYIYIL